MSLPEQIRSRFLAPILWIIGGKRLPLRSLPIFTILRITHFLAQARQPLLGRVFSEEDEQAGSAIMSGGAPAVISHGLWSRRYGSDPDLVGSTISVAGNPLQVIGVMPSDFDLVLPYSVGGNPV